MNRYALMAVGACLALTVIGCTDDNGDKVSVMVTEYDGVVVSADVPGRITQTNTRLLSFTAENRSDSFATVWIAFAVDGRDPGCEIVNLEDWSDLVNRASAAERFPQTRLQPGQSSRGALNPLVSADCIGTSIDLVMVTSSAEPNGEFVSGRTSVEIG